MRHLDLFSGIGGFVLAAQWVWGDDHEIVSFCDNDKAAQIVLAKHWPGVPIHNDIKTLDATKWRGTVDLVTGGFPCQPFSCAGKRKGKADDRYLWPEMLRVIQECRPRWIIGENVAGFAKMGLKEMRSDLEAAEYWNEPISIPACAIDADHIRQRTFILAHSKSQGREGYKQKQRISITTPASFSEPSNGIAQSWDELGRRSRGLRGGDGLSVKMVRDEVALYGNAIVPQVAAEIFRAMKEVDRCFGH